MKVPLLPFSPGMAFLGKRGTANTTGPELRHEISIFLMKSILLAAMWSTALRTICQKVPADQKSPPEDQKRDSDSCKKGRRKELNVR